MGKLSDLLTADMESRGMIPKQYADFLGVSQQTGHNLLEGKTKKTGFLVQISEATGIPLATLHGAMASDVEAAGMKPPRKVGKNLAGLLAGNFRELAYQNAPAPLPPLPLKGLASAGSVDRLVFIEDDTQDLVPRPASLAGVEDAYGVEVHGTSMQPRLRPGDIAEVHPRKRFGPEDLVLVLMPGPSDEERCGLIKTFLGWEDGVLVLEQHNPEKEIRIDSEDIIDIHRIVGAQYR